ncbi:hypothetical protein [Streptomyces canus]|uniref:hypothetical protein n=1 Tax=Streptomyces canus TaxID=58343 RepID=UPI0037F3C973
MAKHDPPIASAAEITPETWRAWAELPGSMVRIRHLSLLLREIPGLPTGVAREVSKRRRWVRSKPKKSLTRSEMKRVRDAASYTVRRARMRISENVALLDRWRINDIPKDSPDLRWGEFLDHLARTGDVPRCPSGFPRNWVKAQSRHRLGSQDMHSMVTQLFPSVVEKGAAAVLLICHESWNLSTVKKLKIPDQWPNADGAEAEPAIHRIEVDKARRRRRRHSSNNLVDLGEGTPGEAMTQIIAMTEQARRTLAALGQTSDLLLWSRGVRHPMFSSGMNGLRDAIDAWIDQVDADLPEGVHSRLLRHSSQVLHGRPRHNTKQVHEEHYLRLDEQVVENSPDVVAAGLNDAVRHARETVQMRLIADDGKRHPQAAEVAMQAGVPQGVAEQVIRGELDTAVAACEDIEHSPVTKGGGVCTASFLMCFACPNALATSRHLPRIIYLHSALEALRSAVSGAAWTADWAGHYHRVDNLLNEHTDRDRWPALLTELSEKDKDLIDRLLDRRLDP